MGSVRETLGTFKEVLDTGGLSLIARPAAEQAESGPGQDTAGVLATGGLGLIVRADTGAEALR